MTRLRPTAECPPPDYLHTELRHRERPITRKDAKRWNKRFANKGAGCVDNGYRRVEIRLPGERKGRLYNLHQVVWAMVHGEWADRHIDHKDGNRSNNAPSNLRLATYEQNNANRRVMKSSTSGVKGVELDKRSGKWCARITSNGKSQRLGSYDKLEDAARAYNRAAKRLFGEFAFTARPTAELRKAA
jgi:HNH endonuclease/AP2 domain